MIMDRTLVGEGCEPKPVRLGPDIDFVFLCKRAGFLNERREIEIGIGARGGHFGIANPFGGGTASFQLMIHRRECRLRLREVGLDRGGNFTRGRWRELRHAFELGLAVLKAFRRRTGGSEAFVDERELAEDQHRANREDDPKKRILAKEAHGETWSGTGNIQPKETAN